MRPGREPLSEGGPTVKKALMGTRTRASYFSPFSVHDDRWYVVHHRVVSENAEGSGIGAQHFYQVSDSYLALRPPIQSDNRG